MTKYVVVISPEADAFDTADQLAQATVLVDTEPPTPRITEMTIRSTAPGGLFATRSQSIDFDGMVQALSAAVQGLGNVHSIQASELPNVSPATSNTTQAPAPASIRTTSSPSKQPPKSTGAPVVPAKSLAGAEGKPDRAYRRMPDADEVRAAFEQAGSVVGLAKHYGVPRHTAQGWMSRIRKITE